jgi:hypothetical protein
METEWRTIAGTTGLYQVSNQGQVRRRRWRWTIDRAGTDGPQRVRVEIEPRPLRPSFSGKGHRRVMMSVNGRTIRRNVAHLVGEAFLPPLSSDQESFGLIDPKRRDDYSLANVGRRGADGVMKP